MRQINAEVAAALREPLKKRTPHQRHVVEQWAMQMSRATFAVRQEQAPLLRCFRRDLLRRLGTNWSGTETVLLVTLYLDPLPWTPAERIRQKKQAAYRPIGDEAQRQVARLFLLGTNALRNYRAFWFVHDEFAKTKKWVTSTARTKQTLVSYCLPQEQACPVSECTLTDSACERVLQDRPAFDQLLETSDLITFAGIDLQGQRVSLTRRIEAVFLHYVNVCVSNNARNERPTFFRYARKRVSALKARVALAPLARDAWACIERFADKFDINREFEIQTDDNTRLLTVMELFDVPLLRCYAAFVRGRLRARLTTERDDQDTAAAPGASEEERLLRLKQILGGARLSPLERKVLLLRVLSCLNSFWIWQIDARKMGADDSLLDQAIELRKLCDEEAHGILSHKRIANLLHSSEGSVRKAYWGARKKIDRALAHLGPDN
jgi:DNA-directed RNA polymerase specialized sigma24 family protein